jgi:coenzyme Q-binding protein COQ10
MAQAELKEILPVDAQKLFQVITDYPKYPEFVDSCAGVQVGKREGSKVQVTYDVNLIKDVSYTLEHEENAAAGTMKWQLVSSQFLKKNSGSWLIKSLGPGKSEVTYTLEIEFKIPVPGLILNSLVKKSLPGMLRNFEKRAKG